MRFNGSVCPETMPARPAPTSMAERARNRRIALSLPRSEQPPIFFHQLDVIGREAGSDIDFAVGDTPVDLQFGDRPAVDENEKRLSTPLDAQGNREPAGRARS